MIEIKFSPIFKGNKKDGEVLRLNLERQISKYIQRHMTFKKTTNKNYIASLNCDKLIKKIQKFNNSVDGLLEELHVKKPL
jgi:hypothetical protein